MNRKLFLSVGIGLAAALLGFQQFGNAADGRRELRSNPSESSAPSAPQRWNQPQPWPISQETAPKYHVNGDAPLRQPVRVARSESTPRRNSRKSPSAGSAVTKHLISEAMSAAQAVVEAESQFAQLLGQTAQEFIDGQPPLETMSHELIAAAATGIEQPAAPADPARPALSPEQQTLSTKIRRVLAIYSQKQLNTAQQSPWEVMHRIVAFGIPTEIRRDGPEGESVNAIGWLLWGNRANGMPLMTVNGGKPIGRVGPGLQGHPAQFLGMLAQSEVSPESPFRLDGKTFTVADLIEQEKLDCNSNMELTFKLIAFSYYLKSDETWTNRDGQKWSISKLIQEELRQPVHSGACGGTHRLFGLSSAYLYRAKRGKPIDGEFQRAKTFIRDYQRYTLASLQNPDGSFSTEWFNRPANASDPARKLQTTGHMLEFLVWSLPDDELRDPRVIKSVEYIATTLADKPDHDWSVGPLGHALHALAIYDKRISGTAFTPKRDQFAKRKPIYTSMVPHERPLAPSAADTPHDDCSGGPQTIDADRYVPWRATDVRPDGASPLSPGR